MVVNRPDYSQLLHRLKEEPETIVGFLASGGRDSTAMVLEAHKLGIDGIMLFNDTYYNRRGATDVLDKLEELTGYKLHVVKYDGQKRPGDLLRESFMRIPDQLEQMARTGKYRKNLFACCRALKERPMTRYLRKYKDEKLVLVLGLKGSDGSYNRRISMSQLRKKETFFRQHKKTGHEYYYPLRDCSDSDIDMILDEWRFDHIKSTGCRICPVFCLFDGMRKADPITWLRSISFARKLGVEFDYAKQVLLTKFCSGD